MMLDQCRRDFSALIDRINVQDAFEKADYKDRYDQYVHYMYTGNPRFICDVLFKIKAAHVVLRKIMMTKRSKFKKGMSSGHNLHCNKNDNYNAFV